MLPKIVASVAFAALMSAFGQAGTPGLDLPVAVGKYLNGKVPAVEPSSGNVWSVQETYTGININLPMHVMPYPGTNKLICVAKEGKILLFDDSPTAATTTTFLDYSASSSSATKVFTTSDCGMTWLVFHPQFGVAGNPNRGYVYITYKWRPSTGANNVDEAYWRVSRFTVSDGTQVADPSTEQILIQQYDRQEFHDSGCMVFGTDGYLYVGIGDEGDANDSYHDGQKINDRLFSGILRIDVNQNAATSHTIRRQPQQLGTQPATWPASFTANYLIPNDNPFVAADGSQLEEFYAIGVRQPYRFSQDAVSGKFWLAESGQDTREELDVVTPGSNFGWPVREGKIERSTGTNVTPIVYPNPWLGTYKEPIWDSPHGTDSCTVGGFVYRGSAHPSLVGKYITVDDVYSHIRAHTLNAAGDIATNELLTDMPSGSVYSGTSTIGWDTAGEPIFVKINGTGTRGRFMKLSSVPALVPTNAAWYRFEDQDASNTTGLVTDNPNDATVNTLPGGVPLISANANAYYIAGSGLSPTDFSANIHGVHIGNTSGQLATSAKLAVFDDFTAEISFRPQTLVAGTYQCFLGIDGQTGTTPATDGEDGAALQPFRLMRFGRTDALGSATYPGIGITNGDLFLNIRTVNPATSTWTTVPILAIPAAQFTTNQWYHLAIVGNKTAGTVTVYRYQGGAYTQIAQASGYYGNLQSGVWSVGRGCYNGAAADFVASADFDELRITPEALPSAKFLYGSQATQAVIPAVELPTLLSQTGAFTDLATLTPAPGVIPYGVNAPLWSDGAAKKRWIMLPNDGVHDSATEKITFLPEGNWHFPAGTVFIKHFELPVDDNNPSIHKRLETRFIVMPTSGEPFGFTYKWRADNSDADLLPGGLDEQIDIATSGGGTRQATWTYPSRSDCRVCHNSNADYVLGVKTQQLNGDYTYPVTGRTANQLETLGALGWFDSTFNPTLVPVMLKSKYVGDDAASLTERVRSYIDSNCSQCHRPNGVRAFFDARLTTPLEQQGLIYGDVENNLGDAMSRVIRPGDPARSVMLQRLGSVADIKMPPIAKHIVDPPAVQMLTDWIDSLGAGPLVTLSGLASTYGTFPVNVHFNDTVTGLTASDFEVHDGSVAGLTGSGADYVLSVNISNKTRVVVQLAANAAENVAGKGNYASNIYLQTVVEPPAADADGLVAWYRLDETSGTVANDSTVASANDGTLVASPVWGTGKFANGLTFSTNNYATLPNKVGNDFSIAFWMKTTQQFTFNNGNTNNAYEGKVIINADSPGNNTDFMIAGTRTGNSGARVHRITVMTGVSTTVGAIQIQGTTSVNTGLWVHVAVTRAKTGGQVKLYINGALQTTATGSTATLNSNSVITLGATQGDATRSYNGSLDEVRFYTKVLSQAEITALQSAPPGPPDPTLTAPNTAFENWTQLWYPGLTHLQGLQGLNLDPDGDGVSNFGEFAYGLDPYQSDRVIVPITHNNSDGSIILSYRALKDKASTDYKVIVSGDLGNWANAAPDISSVSAVAIPNSDYENVTVVYQPPVGSPPAQFFEIHATQK